MSQWRREHDMLPGCKWDDMRLAGVPEPEPLEPRVWWVWKLALAFGLLWLLFDAIVRWL